MTSSPSAVIEFVCNLCGRKNRTERPAFGRETQTCAGCGSTVRTRGIVHMIARELFGADVALPDFPVLKGIRGIGISDSADYAERLAEKFDYRNTHYHKAPQFDVVDPPESEAGQYDFLIASEVFEHVAPPVDRAFENAFRLLKPHGLFFFTVPYTLEPHTTEHFPNLHRHGIAQVGDRLVLVNRTREGTLEVFEDLVFHGGAGSTLEIRRFSESALKEHFVRAGFRSVEIYAAGYEPFGVCHAETWSLPMTARKDPFGLDLGCVSALVEQWAGLRRRMIEELARCANLEAELARVSEWANRRVPELEKEVEERTRWARDIERQFEERTKWAFSLRDDLDHHVELAQRFQAEAEEKGQWALALDEQLKRLRELRWTRWGRAAGFVKE